MRRPHPSGPRTPSIASGRELRLLAVVGVGLGVGRAWLAAVLGLVAVTGCATPDVWRGAQLYRDGTAALDRGDAEQAVALLENAAVLVPHASEIQNHLGLAYAALGRDREALAAFRRAVDLDCDNAAAVHNLAGAERARAVGAPSEGAPSQGGPGTRPPAGALD